MDLEKMYQATILEYAKDKTNHHDIEDATDAERGHNPNCGDDLTLVLKEKDGIIKDIAFLGEGCAMSTASTNMLIHLVKGQSTVVAKQKIDIFFKMMRGDEVSEVELDSLEDAQVLAFLKDMPARIKCGTLSWHALETIIQKHNS